MRLVTKYIGFALVFRFGYGISFGRQPSDFFAGVQEFRRSSGESQELLNSQSPVVV
jgi:hypothetical protein